MNTNRRNPPTSSPPSQRLRDGEKGSDTRNAWKWDVTIYDRPGWSTPWMAPPRLSGDEILLQCKPHPEGNYDNDFYIAEDEEKVTLSSLDGGRSWHRTPDQRYDAAILSETGDGVLVMRPSFPPQLELRRRERLEQAGLGHLADRGKGWTIFPEAMAQELRQMGYYVFAVHPYIPQGQIAVLSQNPIGKWSDDGGKTWQASHVECPTFAHGLVVVDGGRVRLADGTMLVFGYGIPLSEKAMEPNGWMSFTRIYVLRSTDHGRSWTTTRIESDVSVNEASPVVLRSGRVLLLLRGGHIHQTWSDDNGRTWLPVERTPMWGAPHGAIRLRSGAVLCTYAYRRFPGGIRASLSRDEGKTWDVQNEKILRDDIIPSAWISPSGVHSVQLADGSIFTAFTLQKAAVLKEDDIAGPNVFRVSDFNDTGKFHCYLAGCRYTEDYVRPLPVGF